MPNVETYVLSEKSNNLENKEDNNINEKFKNDNNVDKKNNDENNIIKHNVNQNNNEVIVMNNQTEEQINDNKFIKPLNNITGIDPKKKNIYNTVMHINDKMDLNKHDYNYNYNNIIPHNYINSSDKMTNNSLHINKKADDIFQNMISNNDTNVPCVYVNKYINNIFQNNNPSNVTNYINTINMNKAPITIDENSNKLDNNINYENVTKNMIYNNYTNNNVLYITKEKSDNKLNNSTNHLNDLKNNYYVINPSLLYIHNNNNNIEWNKQYTNNFSKPNFLDKFFYEKKSGKYTTTSFKSILL